VVQQLHALLPEQPNELQTERKGSAKEAPKYNDGDPEGVHRSVVCAPTQKSALDENQIKDKFHAVQSSAKDELTLERC
tara:strand:+ start:200 stop:433 length:234 start_codon:yes stop_codon:yes gene_type:complete